MALKRKKQYEGQIEKISGARMTIETQMMTIENANVNLEAMQAMKSGAEAMKHIHGAMYETIFFNNLAACYGLCVYHVVQSSIQVCANIFVDLNQYITIGILTK
jgi:hypothetical protein